MKRIQIVLPASGVACTGDGAGHSVLDLVQDFTFIHAFWEPSAGFASPAGAFHQIADFKIEPVFVIRFFEKIFHRRHRCHYYT